jgi:cell division protein FtsB
MKKGELLLIIVVLIFLGFIFIYFIYNIKNKQLQAIAIQKSKIQSEIQKLNANKTYIPKEVNNFNYENLLSFIRKYNLAKIEQVKSTNNNVNISFKLKGENFLKILDYIYKNEDFLK